jgi:hypothetical protein
VCGSPHSTKPRPTVLPASPPVRAVVKAPSTGSADLVRVAQTDHADLLVALVRIAAAAPFCVPVAAACLGDGSAPGRRDPSGASVRDGDRHSS